MTTTRRRRARSRAQRWLLAGLLVINGGCGLLGKLPSAKHEDPRSYHDNYGLNIEYPEVQDCATPVSMAAAEAAPPLALNDPSELPALDMTLQEAVEMAIRQSPVIRRLGGSIVTTPEATATIYDPALVSSSVQRGTEAALAAFDAQYSQQLFWSKVDTPINLRPPPPTPGSEITRFFLATDEATRSSFVNELSKQTAQGASFSLRHVVDYNSSNRTRAIGLFNSDFSGYLEAEWRQPMLQGAGTQYNRIAGPNALPGQYNGVLIARANEDTALADFEEAIIQLTADVEQAYWDLTTAYRVLDATVKGRAAALQTYQYQQVRLEVGTGRRDEEAQARSQYYNFQAQVERLLGGETGLYVAEQRLRYFIGMPATDGRLIRPTTPLADMKVVFDWSSALGQALERRVEVRRQQIQVKRRELELYAANLNRRPRLDFVGQYRWRGLGDNLIGPTDNGQFDNLYDSITGGNYQEWQAGMELNFPVGFRTASVAIANAKLAIQRERALLAEIELKVSHDLSEASRRLTLTHQLLDTNYNRYVADLRQVDVLLRRYLDGSDNINFLLQAQRQVVVSEVQFYQSLAEYNLAIRDLHRQKGSLLAYNQVQLAEGAWCAGAAADACHVGRFVKPRSESSRVYAPAPVSRAPFNPSAVQDTSGSAVGPAVGPATEPGSEPAIAPQPSVDPTQQQPLPGPLADPPAALEDLPPPEKTLGSSWTIPGVQLSNQSGESSSELISSGPSWSGE
jgi:outer membrane protein TolC